MGGEEEIDIELRLSCCGVKENGRNNCPMNLFSLGSETTVGDAESLNMCNSSGFFNVFSSPEVSDVIQAPKKKGTKEFREQDLLRRLVDGSRSSSSSEEENSVTSCSVVDCTLSLGMSNTVLFSEQNGEFKGLLMSPDRSALPAVAADEDNFSWMKLQEMLRRRRIGERRLHVVGLENPGIEAPPSRSCIFPKITNGDGESSYNTMAVPFTELRSTTNNIHGSQLYKSCWNTTATSANTTSWLLDSRQKPMGSKNVLTSRNHPPCSAVFRSQGSTRIPTNNTSCTNYINNSYGGSSRVVQQQKQKKNVTSQDAKGNSMVRECAKCKTTTTPLWRNGPKGAKSLCNACGIRYKKEERRAASAMAAAVDQSNSDMNNNNATNPVNNEFVKTSCSNSNVVDYSNSSSSRLLKRMKLQGIGAEDFSLLQATT